eukprot:COSAG03_NODE_94_length_13170_cov_67.181470_11_plen_82_part_00
MSLSTLVSKSSKSGAVNVCSIAFCFGTAYLQNVGHAGAHWNFLTLHVRALQKSIRNGANYKFELTVSSRCVGQLAPDIEHI